MLQQSGGRRTPRRQPRGVYVGISAGAGGARVAGSAAVVWVAGVVMAAAVWEEAAQAVAE